jgi:hypothetical protein
MALSGVPIISVRTFAALSRRLAISVSFFSELVIVLELVLRSESDFAFLSVASCDAPVVLSCDAAGFSVVVVVVVVVELVV